MKNNQPHATFALLVASLAAFLPGSVGHATTIGAFDVHGSLSATASETTGFGVYGESKDAIDLNLVDIILNSTHRFDNGLRIGGQVYAYKLGNYNDLTIDFANADYSFGQMFGVRLGRNKLPNGLYNDSQDLDAVRTFASLPLMSYPRAIRTLDASFDGASLYGTFDLHRVGSFEYQIFGGAKESVNGADSPVNLINSYSVVKAKGLKFNGGVEGASFFWNLPVDGLKIGWSVYRLRNATVSGYLGASNTLTAPSDVALAATVDKLMGKGTWDNSGNFAGTSATTSGVDFTFRTYSVEYTVGKWVFAVEDKLYDQQRGTTTIPALALLGKPTTSLVNANNEYYYGAVSYQATAKIGLGYYYSRGQQNRNTAQVTRDLPGSFSKDQNFAASYNLTKWCVVKGEFHLMDGAMAFFLVGAPKPTALDNSKFNYIVVKTTLSF